MPEPITTIGTGAVLAYMAKDGVAKLLGPTAEYLGSSLKELVQKRMETVGKIFTNATSKLGEEIEKRGEVPPKVVKEIVDEGSFSNSHLAVEYLGGILASSRTESGRDDRGARLAKLVNSLLTYQLRTHCLIYLTVRDVFKNSGLSMSHLDRAKMRMFLPYSGYLAAMEFSPEEARQLVPIYSHTFFGLHSEDLIEGEFFYGGLDHVRAKFEGATEGGVILQPSALGAELFLWAFGCSDRVNDYLFSPDFECPVEGLPTRICAAVAVKQ